MKFIYKYARLPKDQKLLRNIDSAANGLSSKLKGLNIDTLNISDYTKKYLKSKLFSLTTNLQLYSYILAWALAESEVKFNEFVFLDYGGGTGVLSLLAKELGIDTVIYNDIYDVSCRDAHQIAESVGNVADHYVKGDIDDLFSFLRKNNLTCNAIASYDVIEHIYDIELFFEKIPSLSNSSLSVVMASGANIFNPIIRKRLVKKQLKIEYKDREKQFGQKERDTLRSYLNVRNDMVLKYTQDLNKTLTKNEIEQLSRRTRGKIEADIQKSVDEYLTTGKFPPEPKHPTNTCDPYTGNWAEHLINPYSLEKILTKKGFKFWILGGYYGRPKNALKRFLGEGFNKFISGFKKQGLKIAPFYTIYGKRYWI